MLLACLGGLVFSMSVIASSSSKMNGAETSRVQEHSFASQEPSAEGDQISTLSDESEDSENIVHRQIRMVRKFPEESQEVSVGHRQTFVPTSQTTCICPEVLSKTTLVAIIGSLAFLGFFSTLVLLLVAIIILRLMDRQWKKEKKERKVSSPPKRPLPSIPPRPPEHVYLVPKEASKYQTMNPINQAAESSYVDPKDLHPGPRIRQEGKYVSSGGTGAETKSTPENGYISMQPAPLFSTSTPEKAYTSMQPAPLFSTSTPENAYGSMQPAPLFSTPSPEHVYASIHRSEAERSYADVDEPQSESIRPEEHVYEEIN